MKALYTSSATEDADDHSTKPSPSLVWGYDQTGQKQIHWSARRISRSSLSTKKPLLNSDNSNPEDLIERAEHNMGPSPHRVSIGLNEATSLCAVRRSGRHQTHRRCLAGRITRNLAIRVLNSRLILTKSNCGRTCSRTKDNPRHGCRFE